MADEENDEVLEFLSAIPDPRVDRCKKYSLVNIVHSISWNAVWSR